MKTGRFCPSLQKLVETLSRSVIFLKAPGSPMDTCHALEVVARAVKLCVSGKIDVVGGRVTVMPWVPISVNQA